MGDEKTLEKFVEAYQWPYGLKLSETDDDGKMAKDFAQAVAAFVVREIVPPRVSGNADLSWKSGWNDCRIIILKEAKTLGISGKEMK